MTVFLYSATSDDGAQVTERIEAENIAEARSALEEQGYCDIVFHYDEAMERTFAREEEMPFQKLPAAVEAEMLRHRGARDTIRFAIKMSAIFWIPLVVWNAWSIWRGPPFGIAAWIGFGIGVAFILNFACTTTRTVLYDLTIEAYNWRRWERMRRAIRLLLMVTRVMRAPKNLNWDLDVRLASALAAEGKADAGLGLVAQYANDANVDRAYFYSRLGDIYAYANNYGMKIENCIRAIEHGEGSVIFDIDYAFQLIRRFKDVVGARAAMQRFAGKEIPAMALPYVAYTEGLIALEEKRYSEAVKCLTEAYELTDANVGTALALGMMCEIKAYLAVALGKAGDKEGARRLLLQAAPWLKAQQEHELIAECYSAVS